MIRWLRKKPADLESRCFPERVNHGSAGQGFTLHVGKKLQLFCDLLIFSKKKSVIYHQSVKQVLDPDQTRHNAGPDLDPNCLQWLSADDRRYH